LAAQETPLEAQVNRQEKLAGMVTSIEAFCQRVQSGLAEATCAQKRTLVELLIDRVIVDNSDVAIRYVIPMTPHGETMRFYQLRKDYFQRPRVASLRTPASELVGIGLPELPAPVAYRLIRQDDAAFGHQLFDVPVAQAEPKVEPDTVADDLGREPMALVGIGCGWCIHAASMAYGVEAGQVSRLI
jgi:hypothetical protein